MLSITATNATNQSQIDNAKIVRPDTAGPNWKGIQHGELVQTVRDRLALAGLVPGELRAFLSKTQSELVAAYAVGVRGIRVPGVVPCFGFQSNNAQRHAIRFYCGLIDQDTDAGIVYDAAVGGRFFSTFDVSKEVGAAVAWWADEIGKLESVVEGLRATPVTDRDFAKILIFMGREDICPWSRIGMIDDAWQGVAEKNAWTLLTVYGRVASANTAVRQFDQALKLYRFVVSGCRVKEAV